MDWKTQIPRWARAGIYSLLCASSFAIAQSDTSTQPKKPAHTASQTSKTSGKTTKSSATAKHTTARATSKKTTTRGKKSSSSKTVKKRGQQGIDGERARAIQEALIREHYMQGEPSGTWDAATQAAMQRYQADQGWQAKTTPDSRALIKLGLGPNHDHLLNPESAMTSAPAGDPKTANKPDPAQNSIPQQ